MPKGAFVFGTGADVHVCTDATLFTPSVLPEYTEVIGVEGKAILSRLVHYYAWGSAYCCLSIRFH